MKAPPALLGAGLVFWGWSTGMLWLGILAAGLLEVRQLFGVRWEFSQADLDRVWNLCVALFLGATIYVFVASDNLRAVGDLLREDSASSRLITLNQSKRSLFLLLQWLPLMFLPLALAQVFGAEDQMDMSTFSWWLRRKRGADGLPTGYLPLSLNVTYPYFACCLFGACAANQRTWWFSVGLAGLVTWALWAHRSPSFAPSGWLGSLFLSLTLGVALLFGMFELQRLVQRFDEALLAQWSNSRGFDVNETQTRIGAIGRLELSSHIVWRVQASKEGPPPLLRQASYDSFKAPFWNLSRRDTEKVTPENNLASWVLHPVQGRTQSATIAGYLHQGTGPLALPSGTGQLDDLPSLALLGQRG